MSSREPSARKRLDDINRRQMQNALANELRRLNLPVGQLPADIRDLLQQLAEVEQKEKPRT